MELTLTCDCGAESSWTAETFAEIREAVAEDGWDIGAATCALHTEDGA